MSKRIRWFSIVRIVGLTLVLAYHFFPGSFPGGFLGVDIFFTFSGYLITSLIIKEVERTANFNVLGFLKRRFLRIFPILVISVLFTLPFLFFLSKDFSANLDKQVTAALGFVTNYFEILKGTSYEAKLLPDIYVHTWSLAIEMQLYIFCGLIAFLVCFFSRKFFREKVQVSISVRLSILILFLSTLIFSYFYMQKLFLSTTEPSVAYFSSLSHSYPFFLGGILSIFFGINLQKNLCVKISRNRKKLSVIAVLGTFLSVVLLISLSIFANFKSSLTYKFGFLASSLLTCVLITCLRILHETVKKNVNEPRCLLHIAEISYPMYLFHWPFLIIFSSIFNNKIFSVTVTVVVSYVASLFANHINRVLFDRKGEKFSPIVKRHYKRSLAAFFIFLSIYDVNILAKCPKIKELERELITENTIQSLDKISEITGNFKERTANNVAIKNKINETYVLERPNSKESNTNTFTDPTKSNKQLTKTSQNSNVSSTDIADVKVVGDSVALGARKALLTAVPGSVVDTKGSRSIVAGYEIIEKWQTEEPRCQYLVVALGTNGASDANKYIDRIIGNLKSGQRLIFVTPFDGRWDETWNSYKTTQYLRSLSGKYSYVTIADWAEKISSNQSLLGSDKVHIGGNSTAIKLYVDTIVEALNLAKTKDPK